MEEEGNIFPGCAQIDILGLVEGAVFSINACVISEGVVNFNYISSLEWVVQIIFFGKSFFSG